MIIEINKDNIDIIDNSFINKKNVIEEFENNPLLDIFTIVTYTKGLK